MFSKENMIFMKDERLRRRSAAQNQRLLLSYKLKYNTSHNGGVLEIKEDPEALPNKPRIPELVSSNATLRTVRTARTS